MAPAVAGGLTGVWLTRVQMLLYTSHQQKMCKRLEDTIAGKYRRQVADSSRVSLLFADIHNTSPTPPPRRYTITAATLNPK